MNGPPPSFPPGYLTETRGPLIIAGNVIPQVFSTLFVAARFYARGAILHSLTLDDWVLVAAWICGTFETITAYVQVAYGAGKHTFAVKPEDAVILSLCGYLAQLSFILALPLTKISICLSYRRVFHSSKLNRILLTSIIAILILTGVSLEFVSIFQCNPIHAFWTQLVRKPGTCINIIPAFYVNGVSNLFTDVALIVIVIPPVLKLQMNRRQRGALLAIISMGSLAVIAGIIRMARTAKLLGPSDDPAWDSYDISIWTGMEIHVSLFCAAAFCVKPVLNLIIPKLLGSTIAATYWSKKSTAEGSSMEMSAVRKTVPTTRQSTYGRGVHGVQEGNSWVALGGDDDSVEGANPSDMRTGSKEGIILKTEEVTVRSQAKR